MQPYLQNTGDANLQPLAGQTYSSQACTLNLYEEDAAACVTAPSISGPIEDGPKMFRMDGDLK